MTEKEQGPPATGWLNAPNIVTLSRVVLGAVAIFCLTSHDPTLLVLAVVLMVLAEFTDFLDGYVARLTRSVTDVGKVLDPMADSMYRLMIFAAFVQVGWMGAWLLAVFVVRDIGVSYARLVALQSGRTVSSRFSGKAKAIAQGVVQIYVATVAAFSLDSLQPLCTPFLLIAAAVTVYSLVDYVLAMTGHTKPSMLTRR